MNGSCSLKQVFVEVLTGRKKSFLDLTLLYNLHNRKAGFYSQKRWKLQGKEAHSDLSPKPEKDVKDSMILRFGQTLRVPSHSLYSLHVFPLPPQKPTLNTSYDFGEIRADDPALIQGPGFSVPTRATSQLFLNGHT